MTYRITGLSSAAFAPLFALDDAGLASLNARRVRAEADRGFPCRVSLVDAAQGESLILLHHVSHDVATPFRAAYAIHVREQARESAVHVDVPPPVFAGRTLSLRGFDAQGMLRDARLACPGEADAAIRALFESGAIAYIHGHYAAPGCVAARIDRS